MLPVLHLHPMRRPAWVLGETEKTRALGAAHANLEPANDGSVVGRSKPTSFDHLVVVGEQQRRRGEAEPSTVLRLDHQLTAKSTLRDQLGAKTSVLGVGY